MDELELEPEQAALLNWRTLRLALPGIMLFLVLTFDLLSLFLIPQLSIVFTVLRMAIVLGCVYSLLQWSEDLDKLSSGALAPPLTVRQSD